MIRNNAQSKAKQFLSDYNLTIVTLDALKSILAKQGYTLVEFNTICNSREVTVLIESLRIEKTIGQANGFTYVDKYRRLVFLNEDLSNDEKLVVLAHEEGHIYCDHFTATPIIGKDVMQEYEANEFAHYILNPPASQRCKGVISRHKKALTVPLILCLIVVAGVLVLGAVQRERSYYGEYYITTSGSKYHEEECIFVKDKTNIHRMTIEEFESGDYEPCAICLPQTDESTESGE